MGRHRLPFSWGSSLEGSSSKAQSAGSWQAACPAVPFHPTRPRGRPVLAAGLSASLSSVHGKICREKS